jgi:hypothetical protein
VRELLRPEWACDGAQWETCMPKKGRPTIDESLERASRTLIDTTGPEPTEDELRTALSIDAISGVFWDGQRLVLRVTGPPPRAESMVVIPQPGLFQLLVLMHQYREEIHAASEAHARGEIERMRKH